MSRGEMHLLAYLKTGPTANHMGAWRHPESVLDDVLQPERYEHLARVLEAGFFDGCFFADGLGLHDLYKDGYETRLRLGGQITLLDPMMVLPLMARATKHLGVGTSLSTTFHKPYHLARMLASLDNLSGGRVAWNIVTSTRREEARNFGMDELPGREERYDMAEEFVDACCQLWDGWEEGAMIMDKQASFMIDGTKVHYSDFAGKYHKTRGPLTIPRSPQGRPVLMQAGSSGRGRDFASRWAEMIFTPASNKAEMQEFYADTHARFEAAGRDPRECAILPSVTVVVGETDSVAKEKADYVNSLIDPELEMVAQSSNMGIDLSKQISNLADAQKARGPQGMHVAFARIQELMEREGIPFDEAVKKDKRDKLVYGSPATIADHLTDLFESRACDGFIVEQMVVPSSLEEFCRSVVPELQRRGVFRRAYRGKTLRDNLRMTPRD